MRKHTVELFLCFLLFSAIIAPVALADNSNEQVIILYNSDYYHTKNCWEVREQIIRTISLYDATYSGYVRCPECKPPVADFYVDASLVKSRAKSQATPANTSQAADTNVKTSNNTSSLSIVLIVAAAALLIFLYVRFGKEYLMLLFANIPAFIGLILSTICTFIPIYFVLDFPFWADLLCIVVSCVPVIGTVTDLILWVWAFFVLFDISLSIGKVLFILGAALFVYRKLIPTIMMFLPGDRL